MSKRHWRAVSAGNAGTLRMIVQLIAFSLHRDQTRLAAVATVAAPSGQSIRDVITVRIVYRRPVFPFVIFAQRRSWPGGPGVRTPPPPELPSGVDAKRKNPGSIFCTLGVRQPLMTNSPLLTPPKPSNPPTPLYLLLDTYR